ncbi:unnamed protein product, partial [Prorocentrum cordatum]
EPRGGGEPRERPLLPPERQEGGRALQHARRVPQWLHRWALGLVGRVGRVLEDVRNGIQDPLARSEDAAHVLRAQRDGPRRRLRGLPRRARVRGGRRRRRRLRAGRLGRPARPISSAHPRARVGLRERLGKPCLDTPIRVVEPCNPGVNETPPAGCEAKPVTDCVVNDWEPWTGCTATCGSGQRERRRTIKVPPANGGKPCVEDLSVTSDCNSQPCENASCVDCSWGAWSDWGDCSGCGGQRYRNRVVDQMPSYCGKPCTGSARDVANCTSPCAKQLFCVWTDWSDADTCGGCGLTTTSRTRSLDFSEGYVDSYLFQGPEDGKCEGDQKHLDECPFVEHCTPPCKPQDCTFSTWSEWHHNPDNCTGLCERHRVVAELNNECGKPCNGTLLETKKCDMTCEVSQDCLLSSWSHWTDCSASENGQYERAREDCDAVVGDSARSETADFQFEHHLR